MASKCKNLTINVKLESIIKSRKVYDAVEKTKTTKSIDNNRITVNTNK